MPFQAELLKFSFYRMDRTNQSFESTLEVCTQLQPVPGADVKALKYRRCVFVAGPSFVFSDDSTTPGFGDCPLKLPLQ